MKNKKLIIIFIIAIVTIILIIKPLSSKYQEFKLKNIKKDIIIDAEYLNEEKQSDTHIGTSLYIDTSKKRVYFVKYFSFSTGKNSKAQLINDKKISDENLNMLIDIIERGSNKIPKKSKNFDDICYKITYNDKTVYTNDEQTNKITIKILADVDNTK